MKITNEIFDGESEASFLENDRPSLIRMLLCFLLVIVMTGVVYLVRIVFDIASFKVSDSKKKKSAEEKIYNEKQLKLSTATRDED
ncbi:MAG TPA: hypothetical protein VD927_09010 [Chryseosolibacter sp.]|nr:hypothetical protein [Chryseosolibacter sp.]